MKVFISWSGARSRAVAQALTELLGDAIQDVEAWMSEHEISAGSRWAAELSRALEVSSFGVLCLTPENLSAPWLLFEAGSLAKSVSGSRVVPYMLDLRLTDVEYPLAQFQGVVANREGTFKLLSSLNEARNEPLPEERLRRVFDRWWPDLEARLSVVPEITTNAAPGRDDRALLEETLGLVRELGPSRASQQHVDQPSNEYVPLLGLLANAAELRALNKPYDLKAILDEIERLAVLSALRSVGTQTGAARVLGLSFRSLRYLVEKHKLAEWAAEAPEQDGTSNVSSVPRPPQGRT
jgi:hypothetical protein